jgi:hypothetical protein
MCLFHFRTLLPILSNPIQVLCATQGYGKYAAECGRQCRRFRRQICLDARKKVKELEDLISLFIILINTNLNPDSSIRISFDKLFNSPKAALCIEHIPRYKKYLMEY